MTDLRKAAEAADADHSAMIEGMCLTWDHSYGLMTPEQRGALRRSMHQIYYHNVRPVLAAERTARKKAEAEYREAIRDRHEADANEKKMYQQWRAAEAAIAALTGAEARQATKADADDALARLDRVQMIALSLGESDKDALNAAMRVVLDVAAERAAPPSRAEVVEIPRIVKALRDIAERKADEINHHPGARTTPQELVEWEAADLIERQDTAIRKLEG